MEITSTTFLAFVLVSLILYWHIPARFQYLVLLFDSIVFYFCAVKWYTFFYVLASALSVYFATHYFAAEKDPKKKKIVLILALCLNFGILGVLKYTNLGINTINFFVSSGEAAISAVKWAAPLAVSFYTLQITAYLLDAYWGVTVTEKNPLKVLLFTCYFPLMISGPICRYEELGNQLFAEHRFDYERVTAGLRRVAWGIAKKTIVADHLAVFVNEMFYHQDDYTGIWVLFAGFLFVLELYFDFSGCMDIVNGVSVCFGIVLPENFKAPFLSRNIQEFWQRWHITLGAWLKNYIMYPILKTEHMAQLAAKCKKKFGKPGKKIPAYIAMFFVWTFMGLWHGNSWKYIIGEGWWFWSVIVLGQVTEPVFKTLDQKLHVNEKNYFWHFFQIVRTLFLYVIGMLFFRADHLFSAFHMLGNLFARPQKESLKCLYDACWSNFGGKVMFVAVILFMVLQLICDFFVYREKKVQQVVLSLPFLVRWSLYLLLIFSVIMLGEFEKSAFIYFGF